MGRRPLSAELVAERARIIINMTAEGKPQRDIAAAVGITPSALCVFTAKHKLRRQVADARKFGRRQWGSETADPATLSREQLEVAKRVGITPERFAWLCTCPHDGKGNARGWRGGASIG